MEVHIIHTHLYKKTKKWPIGTIESYHMIIPTYLNSTIFHLNFSLRTSHKQLGVVHRPSIDQSYNNQPKCHSNEPNHPKGTSPALVEEPLAL